MLERNFSNYNAQPEALTARSKLISDSSKKNPRHSNCVSDSHLGLISMCSEALCSKYSRLDLWVIGHSATRHLCYSRDHFIECKEFKHQQHKKTAGKHSILALGEGTINVTSKADGTFKSFNLKYF